MNSHIAAYFDEIESRFISNPVVSTYQILRREITPTDGIIRLKAQFTDLGTGEFFEYVMEANAEIKIKKYSFHWQDEAGKLIKGK